MSTSSFHLPSDRFLFKKLGQYDAMVEFLECSIRAFLKKYDSSNETFVNFLTRESNSVGIYLRDLSLEYYKSSIVRGYLIFPYSCFDEYISRLRDDVRLLVDTEFKLSDREDKSKLDKLIIALHGLNIIVDIPQVNKSLFEYYRLIRNYTAHGGEKKKIERVYSSIAFNSVKEQFNNLKGPNSIDYINFDDFILATANLKVISGILTQSIERNVQWINFAKNKVLSNNTYKKFDSTRKSKYIMNCIRTEYGVLLDEEVCNKIICSLE